MSLIFERLIRLPFAFHCGRGHVRRDEPLWAVALFRENKHGIANTDEAAFLIEGDSLEYCVTRAEAWAEQQEKSE